MLPCAALKRATAFCKWPCRNEQRRTCMPATKFVCAGSQNCFTKRCNAGTVKAAFVFWQLMPACGKARFQVQAALLKLTASVSLWAGYTGGCPLHSCMWCICDMPVSMHHADSVCVTGGEAAEGHRPVYLLCHGFLLSCRGSCSASAATEGVPATSCIIVSLNVELNCTYNGIACGNRWTFCTWETTTACNALLQMLGCLCGPMALTPLA